MKTSLVRVALSGCCLFLAVAASAQTPAAKPEALGWASSWTQPANETVRKERALTAQLAQLFQAGKFPEALAKSDEGLQEFPNDANWYALRAQTLLKLRRLDAATQDVDHGLSLAVAHQNKAARALFLSLRADLDARHGNYALAVKNLQAARYLDPRDATYANSLAWIRATCPQPAIRSGPESVKLAKTALGLHPLYPYATLDTLATAYAETNDFTHAAATEKEAMASAQKTLGKNASSSAFLRDASTRLQLFERGQAYHHDTWSN